jgi:hypothetical protein
MILVAGLFMVVTALIALDGAGAGSLFRHAYFLPVVVAALRFGAPGGTLAAGAAVLLDAPFVLPEIERSGLTVAALEGLVTFAMLALVGTLSGALRARAVRHRRRYELLATLQRTLTDEATLDVALARLRSALAGRLGAVSSRAGRSGRRSLRVDRRSACWRSSGRGRSRPRSARRSRPWARRWASRWRTRGWRHDSAASRRSWPRR